MKIINKKDAISCIQEKNVYGNKLEYRMNNYGYNGFIQVFDKLVNFPEMSLMDRLVYCACRNYAQASQGKNKTNVTNGSIADRLGVSGSSVSKSITRLQKLGILSLHKSRTKNERIIQIERDFALEQPEEIEYKKQTQDKDETEFTFD